MAASPGSTITEHFATLTDPRIEHTKHHQLLDILTIALCAIISGADEWVAMEQFGKTKRAWFDTFLTLPYGIPSHDTFGRVFAALDPDAFQCCFLSWVQQTVALTGGAVVAVDGKTARRSHDRGAGKAAVHMVSAWASASRLVLGQIAVDEKSNEITAIPALLKLLLLKGCVVTVDAMGCQTAIAATIIDRGADYVLALKENHATAYDDVVRLFADAHATAFADYEHDATQTVDGGHGRVEIRRYWTLNDAATLWQVDPEGAWKGLRGIGMVEAERREKGGAGAGKVTRERRYYLTSLRDAATFARAVRSHWGIENRLHYVRDVTFGEDRSPIRKGHGPTIMAILRDTVVSVLHRAGWRTIAERLRFYSGNAHAALALLGIPSSENA